MVIKYLIFYCLSDSHACEYIIQIGVLGYYYLFVVQRISTVYYYYYHPHHHHQAKQQQKRVCVFERIILMPGKLNDFLFSLSLFRTCCFLLYYFTGSDQRTRKYSHPTTRNNKATCIIIITVLIHGQG